MDFRISRAMQPRDIIFQRGLNIIKARDYTKNNIPWKEGPVTEQLKMVGDYSQISQLTNRRNYLAEYVKQNHSNFVEAGVWYSDIFPSIVTWEDYALITGIISQKGNSTDQNDIPEDIIRICWFSDINKDTPTKEVVRERWDEFSVGSIIGGDTLKIGSLKFEIEKSNYSDEFKEIHLSYVDVNIKTGTIDVFYGEDRDVSEPWHGYIPPYAGGKPSSLSPINGIEKLRATIEPYDLKKIRKLKLKELRDQNDGKNSPMTIGYHLEYMKDLGKIVGVKE